MRPKPWPVVLLFISFVLLSCATLPKKRKVSKVKAATSVGSSFPAFSGTTLKGVLLDQSVFKDKVTLVSAWRIGCAFCMLEIPEYNQLLDSIQDPRFQLISLAPQTMKELVQFYGTDTMTAPAMARFQMGIAPPAYDVLPMCATKSEKEANVLTVQCDALETMLGADGFPVTFIVGPDGVIRHRHDGLPCDPITYKPRLGQFKAELDPLLIVL